MKGFDIYDQLDNFVKHREDYTFTYIGRERGSFSNTHVVESLYGKALGEELGKYDVYVSGSRFDPGPNHILESIACEIPTYSFIDGGGSCEFTGEDHVYKSFNELEKILLAKEFKKNNFKTNTWKNCINQLADIMKV